MIDKSEALAVLDAYLGEWRERSYADLVSCIEDEPSVAESRGGSGTMYQLEVIIVWDGIKNGDVRVIGAVDGGGWRAFVPLGSSFIMAPDGTFVDE